MARPQTELQARLREIAPKAWLRRPPDNQMSYPCFIYRPSKSRIIYADNKPWMRWPCWNVIYITECPKDDIEPIMLNAFEHCSMDREYQSDGLYHYSFTIYF